MSSLSGDRMQQQHLRVNENVEGRTDRFLDVEMFSSAPMTPDLSGMEVEYAIGLIYSSEAGRREATIVVDAGQGTQDLGFRAEVPVLFDARPAVAVKLSRESALWALACIDQLWRVRKRRIAPAERADAQRAYDEARAIYRGIAAESPSQR